MGLSVLLLSVRLWFSSVSCLGVRVVLGSVFLGIGLVLGRLMYLICMRYFFLMLELLLIRVLVMWLFWVSMSRLVELMFSCLVGVRW